MVSLGKICDSSLIDLPEAKCSISPLKIISKDSGSTFLTVTVLDEQTDFEYKSHTLTLTIPALLPVKPFPSLNEAPPPLSLVTVTTLLKSS